MKRLLCCLVSLSLLLLAGPGAAAAGGPPGLRNIRLLTPSLTLPASFALELALKEAGSVLTEVNAVYQLYIDEIPGETATFSWNGRLSGAGLHRVEIPLDANLTPGEWRLFNLELVGENGQRLTYYSFTPGEIMDFVYMETLPFDTTLTLAAPEGDRTAPRLNSLRFAEQALELPAGLALELDLVEAESGLAGLAATFATYDENNSVRKWYTLEWQAETPLLSGQHMVELPLDDSFVSDTYHLHNLELADAEGNTRTYIATGSATLMETTGYTTIPADTSFSLEAPPADKNAPVLHALTLNTTMLHSSSALRLTLELTEEDSGLAFVEIYYYYKSTQGDLRERRLAHELAEPLFTGTHTIEIPLRGSFPLTRYTLVSFSLWDSADNSRTYTMNEHGALYDAAGNKMEVFPVFNTSDAFQLAAWGHAEDEAFIKEVAALADGEAALVYAGPVQQLPTGLLAAAAGRDITLVVEQGDVQWVLHGEDIQPEKTPVLLESDLRQPLLGGVSNAGFEPTQLLEVSTEGLPRGVYLRVYEEDYSPEWATLWELGEAADEPQAVAKGEDGYLTISLPEGFEEGALLLSLTRPEYTAPETPDPGPGKPDPEDPDPETPGPQEPEPEAPGPEEPEPETPEPDRPGPEEPEPETPGITQPSGESIPAKTGEESVVFFWTALLSVMGIGVLWHKKRRLTQR